MTLTVDTITGGNRERDLRTGSHRRLGAVFNRRGVSPDTLLGLGISLPKKSSICRISSHVEQGTMAVSVGEYFQHVDPTMTGRMRKALLTMERTIRLEGHHVG